ncbi:uncharacterized protein LOC121739485 [Aricia agestis]|uniref:uncharacterized protein LOC121739485 n=1 Tax=Aricia agestis TaxID=91739 RepID=UPI001C205A49|nr:uncharacterized protein LOC121739485 [Aricia agestis]
MSSPQPQQPQQPSQPLALPKTRSQTQIQISKIDLDITGSRRCLVRPNHQPTISISTNGTASKSKDHTGNQPQASVHSSKSKDHTGNQPQASVHSSKSKDHTGNQPQASVHSSKSKDHKGNQPQNGNAQIKLHSAIQQGNQPRNGGASKSCITQQGSQPQIGDANIRVTQQGNQPQTEDSLIVEPEKKEIYEINIDTTKRRLPHVLVESQVSDIPLSLFPECHKQEVEKQINQMLEQNIIEPSSSPWSSPIWVVPKKLDSNGQRKWRIVIDYRKLNDISVGETYPIPQISEILDQLGKSKYFTTLDLASGFHQIRISADDAPKTAFSVPQGHFQFNRMPFGLKNAPSTFQKLMNTCLSGLQGSRCFVYLDDIVIYSFDLESHIDNLKAVFDRLRKFNLKLQPEKCQFLRKEVVYLGHTIGEDGVRPNPKITEAVTKFPTPKSPKDIKSFLGLVSYYRRFIPNFSKIAKSLTNLLKKDAPFSWKEEQQLAFETLKQSLISAPILAYPDFSQPFILTCDASNYAISAILSQGPVGRDRPIAYSSRTLNKAEINYSVTEKECLAIVFGTKVFRPYLFGRRFKIITDHKPLNWLFNCKDPGSRLIRWRLKLEEFDYEIQYKKGKINTNADALSRYPVNPVNPVQPEKTDSLYPNPTESDPNNLDKDLMDLLVSPTSFNSDELINIEDLNLDTSDPLAIEPLPDIDPLLEPQPSTSGQNTSDPLVIEPLPDIDPLLEPQPSISGQNNVPPISPNDNILTTPPIFESSAQEAFIDTSMNTSGIYFDPIGSLKIIDGHLKVLIPIDISFIQPSIKNLNGVIGSLEIICKQSTLYADIECHNLLGPLSVRLNDIIRDFDSISHLIEIRSKRSAWFGAVGTVSKHLFGTLDEDDALRYNSAIQIIERDQSKLSQLVKQNILVTTSTLSSLNEIINKISVNEKHINKAIQALTLGQQNLTAVSNNLIIKSNFNQLLNTLESSLLTLSFKLEDIINAIMFSKSNVLYPSIITPTQLFTELVQNYRFLASYHQLPVTLSIENIYTLFSICEIASYYSNNKLVFVLNIPLVNLRNYYLYQNIPYPVVMANKTYSTIVPTTKYIALSRDRSFYCKLDSLNNCKSMHYSNYICNDVDVYSSSTSPTCESEIITKPLKSVPNICETKFFVGFIDIFHRLSNNKFLYVNTDATKLSIDCKDSVASEIILFGTGIFNLPENCVAFKKDLKLIPVHSQIIKIQPITMNFSLLNDTCCNSVMFNKIKPFVSTLNISDINLDLRKIYKNDSRFHLQIPFILVVYSTWSSSK